jgi:D-alanyl-D-alanine carboxypeptidase (penicillin-binding protein 5/6)
MMKCTQIIMTAAAAWSLVSCANNEVVKAIPVAPSPTQYLADATAQGDGNPYAHNVMMPESPTLVVSSGPSIRAASYLLLDARNGQHLAGRNFETARAVASTQKLVTALVVLDAGNLDKMVRVQSSDVAVEPTRMGLKPGEMYSRRTLLYAFLVKSCNDIANVLARDNAGSISAFAAKMNAKVRSLGCTNSNFKNPHGLTVPGQHSTARDMARVAMAAYRNGTLRDAVRRERQAEAGFDDRRADGIVATAGAESGDRTLIVLARETERIGGRLGVTEIRTLVSHAFALPELLRLRAISVTLAPPRRLRIWPAM